MGRTKLTNTNDNLRHHTTFTIRFCFDDFINNQRISGNSQATIAFYQRFYVKLCVVTNNGDDDVSFLSSTKLLGDFIDSLGDVSQQTINSYLRGYRAFGNYCLAEKYIFKFHCSIKEIDPPVKQVYTDAELKKLTVKPKVTQFADFRSYCIIRLILNTGARSNTILNIRIADLDLSEGYVSFNTTKAHKVVRLALEPKTKRDLSEWVNYWRLDKGAAQSDYLFCNEFGEQLSRSGLCKSIKLYNNHRGVAKTSIHLFRHTFAKKWITSGGDIITLAKVLTHSELEMVKRYSNLYSTDIANEIQEHCAIAQLRTQGETLRNRKGGGGF